MKTIIGFETVEELLDSIQGKIDIRIPPEAYLCFENDMEDVSLQPDGCGVVISEDITPSKIIEEMGKRLGIKVHIT
jgi:hypothetical protein